MKSERSLQRGVAKAISHFWNTRRGQAKKQQESGRRDQGARGAVTGGKQMDGFVSLVRGLITDCGLSEGCIHADSHLELPGYFRPEKKWDLLVVDDGAYLPLSSSNRKSVHLSATTSIIGLKKQLGPPRISGQRIARALFRRPVGRGWATS